MITLRVGLRSDFILAVLGGLLCVLAVVALIFTFTGAFETTEDTLVTAAAGVFTIAWSGRVAACSVWRLVNRQPAFVITSDGLDCHPCFHATRLAWADVRRIRQAGLGRGMGGVLIVDLERPVFSPVCWPRRKSLRIIRANLGLSWRDVEELQRVVRPWIEAANAGRA